LREPDFLGIGAQKGGTAWLYDQLSVHPQVWMPPIKEMNFFGDVGDPHQPFMARARNRAGKRLKRIEQQVEAGRVRPPTPADELFLRHILAPPAGSKIDWYAQSFQWKGDKISGDITPAYSGLEEESVAAIAERFPRLKVIFLARDPVDRAWSALNMRARNKRKSVDLTDWRGIERTLRDPGRSARSSPSKTVRTWRKFFPEERFFLGFFDDLVADPAGLRERICRFLAIDPELGVNAIPPDYNRKSSRAKVPMPPEIRAKLVEHYRQEYRDSAETLGGPAEKWLERQERRIAEAESTPTTSRTEATPKLRASDRHARRQRRHRPSS